MAANKDINKLLKSLKRQGFRVEHKGKHIKAFPPNQDHEILTISSSPSDKNAIKQILRQLKKMGYKV